MNTLLIESTTPYFLPYAPIAETSDLVADLQTAVNLKNALIELLKADIAQLEADIEADQLAYSRLHERCEQLQTHLLACGRVMRQQDAKIAALQHDLRNAQMVQVCGRELAVKQNTEVLNGI